MRLATYYLATGREVDIYLNEDGTYTAKDAFLSESLDFGKHFPTWDDVSSEMGSG